MFGRVTLYIRCVYILEVVCLVALSPVSVCRCMQQRMGWVEDLRNFSLLLSFFLFFFTFYHAAHSHQVNIYRSEFPGLRANWILCDAAGGTQVLSLRVIVGGTQMFFVPEGPRY